MLWALTSIILFLTGSAETNGETTSWRQSICGQKHDEGSVIACLDIRTNYEKISQWAPGPYVLLMSIYGCPESYAHGWREGYILLTFQEATELFISRGNFSLEYDDILKIDSQWPYFVSFLLTQYSDKSFKLNFCYKYRQSKTLDTGRWPDGNYSVYTADSVCPTGCTKDVESIRLPRLTSWTTNGYVPDFNITQHNDYAVIQFSLCRRVQQLSSTDTSVWETIAETPFIFVQNFDSYCPVLDVDSYFEEETLLFKTNSTGSSYADFDIIFGFCYLYPSSWITANSDEIIKTFGEDAFIWSTNKLLSDLKATRKSYLYVYPDGAGSFGPQNQTDYISWKLLDTGRTFTVAGIRLKLEILTHRLTRPNLAEEICISISSLTLMTNTAANATSDTTDINMIRKDTIYDTYNIVIAENERAFEPTNTSYPECMISRGQWDFLHFSALSCPTVPGFLDDQEIIVLMFLRDMDGRYIALIGSPNEPFLDRIFEVDVFTKRFSYYGGDSCNIDLGMKDDTMQNVQLSASSSHQGYPLESSRPFSQGWCADMRDQNPSITIDLLTVTEIEGITLWSWIEGNAFIFGTLRFKISYAVDRDINDTLSSYETSFYSDSSRSVDEQQSFWFLKPFTARYVKILITEPFTEGLSCLRFELHGCRSTGGYKVVPSIYRFQAIDSSISFIQTISTENLISSIGFPDMYESGQHYRWIITFYKGFIKIVFTDISLAKFQRDIATSCNDSIWLSNRLLERSEVSQIIDYRLNDELFFIESSQRQLVISFIACPASSTKLLEAKGFQAVITDHSNPACFTLGTPLLSKNRNEFCRRSTMVLTSMSLLGLSFVGTTELWTIHYPRKRVQLIFKDFFVACKNKDGIGSTLKVIESTYERTFCSLSRPPDTIYSVSDLINISFARSEIRIHEVPYTEGFRLIYHVMNTSYEHLIGFETKRIEVTDVAMGKPAFIKGNSVLGNRFFPVENTTARQRNDGIVGCFDIDTYGNQPAVWWTVDLQDIYRISYIVLFYEQMYESKHRSQPNFYNSGLPFEENIYGIHLATRVLRVKSLRYYTGSNTVTDVYLWDGTGLNRLGQTEFAIMLPGRRYIRNTEISTGLNALHMPLTSFECREPKRWDTIFQHEIHARYVKLLHTYKRIYPLPPADNDYVHGTLCEVKIYGVLDRNVNEERRKHFIKRTKEKMNQLEFDSYKFHEVYHCPLQASVDREYSQWSKWSACSEKCGIGSRRRTRVCKISSCKGEDAEYELCEGEMSCPVWHCAKHFGKCYSIFYLLSNWKLARHECLRRNLSLVTIHSLEELRFIKYLFREKRYMDIRLPLHLQSLQYDARYYTHIGLYLDNRKKVVKTYIWENRTQTIFSAWKPGEPSVGNCVRMNYQHFEPESTWESEDCSQTLADSFVCETTDMNQETLSDVEVLRWKNLNHSKRVNKTFTGKTCQAWRQKTPHQHNLIESDFPGETLFSVSNYCRDPFFENYLWCYTTDVQTQTEACIVDDKPSTRCLKTMYDFSGKQNTSFSGKACQRWEGYEEVLKQNGRQLLLPEYTLLHAENYCRDPFKDGFTWCYTEESEWEPCNNSLKDSNKKEPYTFTSNETTAVKTYRCGSGDLIPFASKCDHIFDCEDLTDETHCLDHYKLQELVRTHNFFSLPERLEETSYFLCDSGELISLIARCDHIKDCLDASDEINCTQGERSKDEPRCSPDEFSCSDGDCIHISQVCDFVLDCIDGSDEYCTSEGCSRSKFECNNGQCIEAYKKCDGFIHCLDGSDEINCEVCNNEDLFHCDSTRCIPRRLRCDGYTDCDDKSDETSCTLPSFKSCRQWWDAGYRTSGTYSIAGIDVICDFDLVVKEGTIRTIFNNRDYLFDKTRVYFGNEKGLSDSAFLQLADFTVNEHVDENICTFEVTESCSPGHAAVLDYDSIYYSRTFNVCVCDFGYVEKYSCIRNKCTNPYTSHMTCTPPKTLILRWLLDAILIPISTHWQVIQINISPLVCKTEYKSPADVLACEGDVKVIDSALRCVYDVDAYGYVLGCRSKSHLENCGQYKNCYHLDSDTFECPPNTVKCPGTYCIPLKFVCDGELQCPGGEDEKDCGCKSESHEVIIVVDYNFLTNGDLSVEGFAKQLGNHESIIRILSYEADQPLQNYDIGSHRLIIEDISLELRGFENTKEKCKYNIISEQFLSQLRFSDKKIKSVIFLETDSTAAVVANEIFSNNHSTFESGLLLYRVNEDPNAKRHVIDKYQHVTDIYIPRWKTLTDIGADFFPKLCGVSSKVYCPGKYKCAASRMYISLDNLCDGIKHCIHGDDERLCDFKCPVNCTCIGFAVSCHNKGLQIDMIKHISKNTRSLDLSKNSVLGTILQASYLDIEGLVRLNLSQCNVEYIMPIVFDKINNIKILDLSSNLIRTISSGTFSGLKLEIVYLFNNDFISIEDFAFNGMSVEIIDFEPSSVSEFNKNIFTGVRNVKELRTPAFKFCCVRPNYLPEENCYPNKDEFSSCEDLMRLSALQTMLWLVGFSAFFGNILSVLYRLKYDRNRLKLGFGIFVTNLAVADFAMGVYLIIIAVADAVFRKRYIFNEDYWRNSVWCNLAGVLSTLSSEASVLFLCLITLDRLLVIKFPFGNVKFNSKKAIICACFVWLFALTIALVPILYGSYFQNKFYTKSGICIALPFTRDRPPGWLYSVALFVGFNFATFLLVAFGQWSIFMEIRKSSIRTKKPQAARKRDLVVARNLLLVVTTDFLCWFPIGVMGIMALNDHVIPADVYAWTAVFILPVNSALNPVLYTLTAILGKTTFNPSTDEQNRTELTKDFGNYFMNCHQLVNRYMSTRVMPRQKYRSVSSILDAEIHVPVHTLLQISSKIFKFLDVIQNGAMVLGTLNKQSVYLSVCHRQVTGSIRIQGKPSMSRNPADENDIRDAAVIIHNLLRNIDKKTITVE